MAICTLEEAKLQLRVDQSFEDSLIQDYIDGAEAFICRFLNLETMPETIPIDIKNAGYLIISDMYENRSGQTDKQLYKNSAVESLLFPHREQIGIN